jgi:hypothetical protein
VFAVVGLAIRWIARRSRRITLPLSAEGAR